MKLNGVRKKYLNKDMRDYILKLEEESRNVQEALDALERRKNLKENISQQKQVIADRVSRGSKGNEVRDDLQTLLRKQFVNFK